MAAAIASRRHPTSRAPGAPPRTARRIAAGERVACLFGPERTGLDNEDVARANAIVTVDVNPQFLSLNLASCVLLLAYEWRRATVEAPMVREQMAGTEWAEALEVEHRHGLASLEEAITGAQRFAAGAGRHGEPA